MYKVEFEKGAKKSLDKLDSTMRKRIIKMLDRASQQDDPKISGHPLSYGMAGKWVYKQDYIRIICDINEQSGVIKVIDIAKREKQAYGESYGNLTDDGIIGHTVKDAIDTIKDKHYGDDMFFSGTGNCSISIYDHGKYVYDKKKVYDKIVTDYDYDKYASEPYTDRAVSGNFYSLYID